MSLGVDFFGNYWIAGANTNLWCALCLSIRRNGMSEWYNLS